MNINSAFLVLLKNRINLQHVPFTERGSRLLVYQTGEGLLVRLAERWYKRSGQLAEYRNRPPVLEHLQFTAEHGNPLTLQTTTYPHCLEFQTEIGVFSLFFLDLETLLLVLPPGKSGLSFLAHVDRAQTDRRGGFLQIQGSIQRNIAYTTNARIISNQIDTIDENAHRIRLALDASPGDALLLNITPRLGLNRYIPHPQPVLERVAHDWDAWFAAAPMVALPYQRQYYYAWWIMRAGLISTRYYTTREAMTPSKFYYLGVWQWDAYFHALAYRHIDQRLAQDQLRILLDHQREDGMLPDAVHDEGLVTRLDFPVNADVTKPPLIAWAAWKLFQSGQDREFLDEIYEPLTRWNRWWFEKNDLDHNGLCEYQHPYSSGLDDSPLWDDGMPVESPDLNTYLCLQQENLANIAEVIGEKKMALEWRGRADEIAGRMLSSMWDEAIGLFWASRNGRRVQVRTLFNLFPLLTGRLPTDVADHLLSQLTDSSRFWTPYPLPCVALDDPKFDPNQMWRGPSWTNINYLVIEGLNRIGQRSLAKELRYRTLNMISEQPDIYEYYNPLTGVNPPKAAPIFGWSSAVFIDLAIQAARDSDWPAQKDI
jgi:putative isomerase